MNPKYEEASLLYKRAHSFLEQGDSENALKHYRAALELLKDIGDRNARARVLNNMGHIHVERCEWDDALKCFKEANPSSWSKV